MTTLGLIFAAAYGVAIIGGRRWMLTVLATSMAFNDSIMMAVGQATITPFYFGLILFLLCSITIWRQPTLRIDRPHGALLLGILFVYGLLVTVLSPALFAGVGIISAGDSLDLQAHSLTPLSFTSSNIAQMAYLLLTVGFVLENQRTGVFDSHYLTIGLAVGTVTAFSAIVWTQWPHMLFDNSPRWIPTIETGRPRGQFSEPSHLGAFALTAAIYFGILLFRTRSTRSFLAHATLTGMSLALLYASATGTAALGLGVSFVCISLVMSLRRSRQLRSIRIPVPLFLASLATVVAAGLVLPRIVDLINSIVSSKIGSESLTNRSIVDENSISVFVQTFGLGAGNGSNRGSSMLLMLLSQIGLVGTALFIAIAVRAVRRGLQVHANVPASFALIGFLSAAAVSLPDFASPVLWSLIAVTYAKAVTVRSTPDRHDVQIRSTALGVAQVPSVLVVPTMPSKGSAVFHLVHGENFAKAGSMSLHNAYGRN